jgi:hypothetical protein
MTTKPNSAVTRRVRIDKRYMTRPRNATRAPLCRRSEAVGGAGGERRRGVRAIPGPTLLPDTRGRSGALRTPRDAGSAASRGGRRDREGLRGRAFPCTTLGWRSSATTFEGWMWGLSLPLVLLPAATLEVRKLVLARRRVAEAARTARVEAVASCVGDRYPRRVRACPPRAHSRWTWRTDVV